MKNECLKLIVFRKTEIPKTMQTRYGFHIGSEGGGGGLGMKRNGLFRDSMFWGLWSVLWGGGLGVERKWLFSCLTVFEVSEEGLPCTLFPLSRKKIFSADMNGKNFVRCKYNIMHLYNLSLSNIFVTWEKEIENYNNISK